MKTNSLYSGSHNYFEHSGILASRRCRPAGRPSDINGDRRLLRRDPSDLRLTGFLCLGFL